MAARVVVEDGVKELAEGPKFRKEVYEKLWTIPNWERTQQSFDYETVETIEFQAGRRAGIQTKWIVGLTSYGESGRTSIYMYRKLIEAQGFPDGKIKVTWVLTLLVKGFNDHFYAPVAHRSKMKGVVEVGEVMNSAELLVFDNEYWRSCTNSHGELVFKLELKVMEPKVPYAGPQMEMFYKGSIAQVLENFGSLLGDQATADLKITTSDEKELFAHKLILKAQCPVFESMFRSDMSENKTGVVDVKDVTAKTMGIFLHLFYTGKLLPSWKDPDTVVEFTYAAGKYQLANVLKFLDEALGNRDEEDAFHVDVQLLDLTQKLDLKTAEMKLLARLKKAINGVNSGAEFLSMYCNGKE